MWQKDPNHGDETDNEKFEELLDEYFSYKQRFVKNLVFDKNSTENNFCKLTILF